MDHPSPRARQTELTCSVEVAASKYVAKVASSRAKPDGMLVVPASETTAFLHPLPVSALWGVGKVTEQSLLKLGLRTVGDVAEMPGDALTRAVGLRRSAVRETQANGIDLGMSRRAASRKHRARDHLPSAMVDHDEIARELLRLAVDVGVRLRKAAVVARTVTLKLRYGDFTTVTRSRTLAEPTDVARASTRRRSCPSASSSATAAGCA